MSASGGPPTIAAGASVDERASVGDGTTIWDGAVVRAGAKIGAGCTVGRGVYIDADVVVGDRCKIQDNALLYRPASIGDGVFVGPAVVLTNDRHPRAIAPDGELIDASGWQADGVSVAEGAALGAACVVVAGRHIGRWAMVAAGAVVTADVLDHALVVGNPARQLGWVGRAGHRLEQAGELWQCTATGESYRVVAGGLELVHEESAR